MRSDKYCVIMAGGVGSRFWPLSRQAHPKQFMDILGVGKSFLQQTFLRFKNICPPENIFVVTSSEYFSLVKNQIPDLPDDNILLEPIRRNTGPCIAYAMYKINKINPDAKVVVAPSDHLILNDSDFENTINRGLSFASKAKSLITIGIKPTRPETGYGYIQLNSKSKIDPEFSRVKTFTEKPDLELAKTFVESGEFLWNSGIFIWTLPSILEELEKHLPDVSRLFKKGEEAFFTNQEISFIQDTYSICPSISIDFGVMEKSDSVFVIGADFGWSDLGTWGSLYDNHSKDTGQNAVIGQNVMLYQTTNSVINVPDEKLVVLQGLDDYIVVESDSILLICRKKDEQSIRQFVNDVKLEKGENFV
jgi:mannose-1-phosphate guanylyltransferase